MNTIDARLMGYPDAKQAIVAKLVQPRGKPHWNSGQGRNEWRRAIYRGGGHDADPSTIRFLKHRGLPGHELHAVTFADQSGLKCRFLVGAVQASGGWEVKGLAGGGQGDPPRDRPWVNLCGWGWPDSFCGGGWITGSGSEIATRVRLMFRKGPTLDDTVDDGIVLFMTAAPVDLPATSEILDATGSLIAGHSAF